MNSPKKILPVQQLQQLRPGQVQRIPATEHLDATVHQWSQAEIDALTLAVSARRPLLVRGEPGTGKTQLARAAAHQLGWALHATTIHPRFEASDLIYRFDASQALGRRPGAGTEIAGRKLLGTGATLESLRLATGQKLRQLSAQVRCQN